MDHIEEKKSPNNLPTRIPPLICPTYDLVLFQDRARWLVRNVSNSKWNGSYYHVLLLYYEHI